MAVPGVFPTVAGNPVSAADAAGGQHHSFGFEDFEASPFALVAERADYPIAVFEQRDHRAFHMDINAAMDAMILQCADQLQARSIPHMRQARVLVPAEVSL